MTFLRPTIARLTPAIALFLLLLPPAPAHATEAGGGVYQNGAEGFTAAALPPPGTYFLTYGEHYTASRFNNGDGHSGLLSHFHADVSAIVPRVVQVDHATFLGATIGHAMMLPLVDSNVTIAGTYGHKEGISDMTVTPLILGWAFRNGLHIMATADINVPIGTYDRRNVADFSRHYWNIEPIVTLAYYGSRGFTFDLKAMYDINAANHDAAINGFNPTGANYQSGQELHLDYAVGQRFGKKWQIGIAGYYYRQTTGDRVRNAAAQAYLDSIDGLKGTAFAIGPSIHRTIGKAQLIGTWQHEIFADYRPQGERFWLKLIVPVA